MHFLPFLHFFAFIVYTSMAGFVLFKNPRSALNRLAAAFTICFAIWSFGGIFFHNPEANEQLVMTFVNINAIGWSSFGALFLWFSLIFTKNHKKLPRKIVYPVLAALPLFFIYLQFEGKLIEDLVLQPYGWSSVWSQSIWTYLFDVYYVSFMGTGLYLLYQYGKKTDNQTTRGQTKALFVTALISLVLGILSSGFFPRIGIHEVPELANLSALAWTSGMFYTIVRYNFLNITPATAAENILSTMTDFLILTDPNGKIVEINQATIDALGYSREELLEQPLEQFVSGDHYLSSYFDLILQSEQLKNYNLVLRTKIGVRIPVLLSSSMLKDVEGKIGGIVIIAKNISRMKRTEEMLRESEQKFRTFVDSSPDIIYTLSPETAVIKSLNPAFETITGWPRSIWIGQEFFNLLHQDDIESAFQDFRAAVNSKEPIRQQSRIRTKNGQYLDLETLTTPETQDGRTVNLLGFGRDVTKRTQAEAEREKLIHELQHALERVKTLRGLIPICASCKKIRDDKGYWHQVEEYIREHSDAEFSHGICKDCARALYPEMYADKDMVDDDDSEQ
jgi:PAS domain S-box-containing protein